jgi:hypothetical protein
MGSISSRSRALTSSRNPSVPSSASCWIVPSSGLQMSKPWLPATIRSSTPMSSCTTCLSRPLTTHTGHRSASPRTASRMLSEMSASSGWSTMGGRAVVVEEPGGSPTGQVPVELLPVVDRAW